MLSGEYERGIEELRRNVELLTEQSGPEAAAVGRAWTNLAWALDQAERFDEAIEIQRRGRDIMLAANPDAPNLFEPYTILGRMLFAREDYAAALPELERARELGAAHDADANSTIHSLFRLARARAATGAAEPEAPAREALALIEEQAPEDEVRAEIEAWLAQREASASP